MKPNIYIFIISLSVLLRMRNVSDKRCREIQNTHFMFNDIPPLPHPPEKRAVYELMLKNVVMTDRSQMSIRYGACSLHAGCLMQGYRHTNSEYLTLIYFLRKLL